MNQATELFQKELLELCEKHGLVAVPAYEMKPSAHDPMFIVRLDDFWREFLRMRVYDYGEFSKTSD